MGRIFRAFHGTSCNSQGRSTEKLGCSSTKTMKIYCSLMMSLRRYALYCWVLERLRVMVF
jgi:hypothetical protein